MVAPCACARALVTSRRSFSVSPLAAVTAFTASTIACENAVSSRAFFTCASKRTCTWAASARAFSTSASTSARAWSACLASTRALFASASASEASARAFFTSASASARARFAPERASSASFLLADMQAFASESSRFATSSSCMSAASSGWALSWPSGWGALFFPDVPLSSSGRRHGGSTTARLPPSNFWTVADTPLSFPFTHGAWGGGRVGLGSGALPLLLKLSLMRVVPVKSIDPSSSSVS
mmetsp:Transcript_16194/g.47226  ORF Transcript_16194/g.47226 Transcript_16194/m.47226 type:complete len:242 (-) Transcript_16194:158-883(-)